MPKYEYEFVERVVEIPQIQYIEKTVEIPQIQDVIVTKPVKVIQDRPREVIKTVPKTTMVPVEKIVEAGSHTIEVRNRAGKKCDQLLFALLL